MGVNVSPEGILLSTHTTVASWIMRACFFGRKVSELHKSSLALKKKLQIFNCTMNPSTQNLQFNVSFEGQSYHLAQGHKCHDRHSNPHFADQKRQSLSLVLKILSAISQKTVVKVKYLYTQKYFTRKCFSRHLGE